MRKTLIVVIIAILGIGGYLGWDWYDKTHRRQLEPSMTLYYWTDTSGEKHISDRPPPKSARHVRMEKGYRHIRTPLIVTFKNKVVDFYLKIRKKLFKSRKTKKRD